MEHTASWHGLNVVGVGNLHLQILTGKDVQCIIYGQSLDIGHADGLAVMGIGIHPLEGNKDQNHGHNDHGNKIPPKKGVVLEREKFLYSHAVSYFT